MSDVEKSLTFYTGPMGMTHVGEIQRQDHKETVLVARSGGVALALMQLGEAFAERVKNVPAKLVFAVPDAAVAAQRIAEAGYSFQVPGLLALDPDGYIIELMQQEGLDHAIFAVGIGVADTQRATDFYVNTLGMLSLSVLDLGFLHETVLVGGGAGFSIVLMAHGDGIPRNYQDNPVKLVFRVSSPEETLTGIQQSGGTIVRPVAPTPALNGAQVGIAKDPDGYTLEFLPP